LGFHVVYYGFEFFAFKVGTAWEVAHGWLCRDGGGDGGRGVAIGRVGLRKSSHAEIGRSQR
jgi:hypothetical protein